ncbi:MAG: site-specific DNA-methyltransferase, partial [Nannocystaceae bacterium]
DPPFATGGRFEVVTAVGPGRDGPRLRQPAYTDAWPGGVAGLLAMLDPRLRLLHELLAPHGSAYVHVDPTVGHAVKLLLDEVFGPGCFQREIVWRIGWVSGFKTRARNWIRNHDLIFFYVKDPARFTFNKHYMPHPPGYRRRDGSLPKGKGVPLDDVWNAGDAELALRGRDSLDSIQIKSFSTEKTGYATQKNESLLRRIVEASSNPGDLVLDAFCGSGTTLTVAEQMGRRWVGCDTGRAAIHIATRRLLAMSRPRGFEVLTVADDERRAWQAALVAADSEVAQVVAEQWRALVGDSAPKLRVVEAVDVKAGPSPDRGAVAAWRWSVEVAVEADDDGVLIGEGVPRRRGGARSRPQLVLQRAIVDPRLRSQPGLALAERALLQVRLRGLSRGEVEVELVSLAYPTASLLPAALAEAGPLDLVEYWTVTWDATDDGPIDVVRGRFERDRELPRRSPAHAYSGRSRAVLLLAVHDALHREHRLRCELSRGDQGWTVAAARCEVEG